MRTRDALEKIAGFYDANGKYVGDTPPKGAKVVKFDPDRHKFPKQENVISEKNILPWLMAIGGGVLGHTATSAAFDDSDDEKRNRSVWEKVLSAILPLGIGGAGAYLGHLAGKKLVEKSAEGPGEVYDLDEANKDYGGTPWGRWAGAVGLGGAGAGLGSWAWGDLKAWDKAPLEVPPGPAIVGAANDEAADLAEQISKAEKANEAAAAADARDLEEYKRAKSIHENKERSQQEAYNKAKADYDTANEKYKADRKAFDANASVRAGRARSLDARIKVLEDKLGRISTGPKGGKAAKAIVSELRDLYTMRGQEPAEPIPPTPPRAPSPLGGGPTPPGPRPRVPDADIEALRRRMQSARARTWTNVPNAERPKLIRRAAKKGGGAGIAAWLAYLLGRSAMNYTDTGDRLEEAKAAE